MKKIKLLKDILNLPKVEITFKNCDENSVDTFRKTYKYFTKPHRYKVFRNKTIGVGLIDLNEYDSFQEYHKVVNKKNYGAYYARRAQRKGYRFIEIDRNDYIDDIYEINTSAEFRQGKKMSEGYLTKVEYYEKEPGYKYYGIVNEEGKLVAYCNIPFFGEFTLLSVLLGHDKYLKDRIMYFMIYELVKVMFEVYKEQGYKYIMYDTFFGASEGLQQFKRKIGFKPYKVKWRLEC